MGGRPAQKKGSRLVSALSPATRTHFADRPELRCCRLPDVLQVHLENRDVEIVATGATALEDVDLIIGVELVVLDVPTTVTAEVDRTLFDPRFWLVVIVVVVDLVPRAVQAGPPAGGVVPAAVDTHRFAVDVTATVGTLIGLLVSDNLGIGVNTHSWSPGPSSPGRPRLGRRQQSVA